MLASVPPATDAAGGDGAVNTDTMKKEKDNEALPQVEGYTAERRTISILAANLWALVLLFVAGVAGVAAIAAMWDEYSYGGSDWLWFLAMMVVGLVVHELVHGLTWLLLVHKGFSHLSFGVMTGAVYCHIDVPMAKRQYVVGALMPLVLVGVVPWVAGIAAGSMLWMAAGAAMIAGAAGDLMIVWALRKEEATALVYDHPSEAGCYVYRKAAHADDDAATGTGAGE